MVGRPREFDESIALEQAMHLFWEQGYEATSLQALTATMGLSRSSFYQTFASKHALLARSLQLYRQVITDRMLTSLARAERGLDFLRDTLTAVADGVDLVDGRRGCLVMNCASELAPTDPVVAALVNEAIDDFRAIFLAGVRRAQKEGDISAATKSGVLADYLVSCKSGLETMAKAGTDRATLRNIAAVMIDGLTRPQARPPEPFDSAHK